MNMALLQKCALQICNGNVAVCGPSRDIGCSECNRKRCKADHHTGCEMTFRTIDHHVDCVGQFSSRVCKQAALTPAAKPCAPRERQGCSFPSSTRCVLTTPEEYVDQHRPLRVSKMERYERTKTKREKETAFARGGKPIHPGPHKRPGISHAWPDLTQRTPKVITITQDVQILRANDLRHIPGHRNHDVISMLHRRPFGSHDPLEHETQRSHPVYRVEVRQRLHVNIPGLPYEVNKLICTYLPDILFSGFVLFERTVPPRYNQPGPPKTSFVIQQRDIGFNSQSEMWPHTFPIMVHIGVHPMRALGGPCWLEPTKLAIPNDAYGEMHNTIMPRLYEAVTQSFHGTPLASIIGNVAYHRQTKFFLLKARKAGHQFIPRDGFLDFGHFIAFDAEINAQTFTTIPRVPYNPRAGNWLTGFTTVRDEIDDFRAQWRGRWEVDIEFGRSGKPPHPGPTAISFTCVRMDYDTIYVEIPRLRVPLGNGGLLKNGRVEVLVHSTVAHFEPVYIQILAMLEALESAPSRKPMSDWSILAFEKYLDQHLGLEKARVLEHAIGFYSDTVKANHQKKREMKRQRYHVGPTQQPIRRTTSPRVPSDVTRVRAPRRSRVHSRTRSRPEPIDIDRYWPQEATPAIHPLDAPLLSNNIGNICLRVRGGAVKPLRAMTHSDALKPIMHQYRDWANAGVVVTRNDGHLYVDVADEPIFLYEQEKGGNRYLRSPLTRRQALNIYRYKVSDVVWGRSDEALYPRVAPFQQCDITCTTSASAPNCFWHALLNAIQIAGIEMPSRRQFEDPVAMRDAVRRYLDEGRSTLELGCVIPGMYIDGEALACDRTLEESREIAHDHEDEGFADERDLRGAAHFLRVRINIATVVGGRRFFQSIGKGPDVSLWLQENHYHYFNTAPGQPCVNRSCPSKKVVPPLLPPKTVVLPHEVPLPLTPRPISFIGGIAVYSYTNNRYPKPCDINGRVICLPPISTRDAWELPVNTPPETPPSSGTDSSCARSSVASSAHDTSDSEAMCSAGTPTRSVCGQKGDKRTDPVDRWICAQCKTGNAGSPNCFKCKAARVNAQDHFPLDGAWKCAECSAKEPHINVNRHNCSKCQRLRIHAEVVTVEPDVEAPVEEVTAYKQRYPYKTWYRLDSARNCVYAAREMWKEYAKFFGLISGYNFENHAHTTDTSILLRDGVDLCSSDTYYKFPRVKEPLYECYYEIVGNHVSFWCCVDSSLPRLDPAKFAKAYLQQPPIEVTVADPTLIGKTIVEAKTFSLGFAQPSLFAPMRHRPGCSALSERVSLKQRALFAALIGSNFEYATYENCDCGAWSFDNMAEIPPRLKAIADVFYSQALPNLHRSNFDDITAKVTRQYNTFITTKAIGVMPAEDLNLIAVEMLRRSRTSHIGDNPLTNSDVRLATRPFRALPNFLSKDRRRELTLCTLMSLPRAFGRCTQCGANWNGRHDCNHNATLCRNCQRPLVNDRELHQRYCCYCTADPVVRTIIDHMPYTNVQTHAIVSPHHCPPFFVDTISARKMGPVDKRCKLTMRPFPAAPSYGPHLCGIGTVCSIPLMASRDFEAVKSSLTARLCHEAPVPKDMITPTVVTTELLAEMEPRSVLPYPKMAFCERWGPTKRQDMVDAMHHLKDHPLTKHDCERQLFLKTEKLTKDITGKPFAARVISSTSPRAQFSLGRYTLSVSKYLKGLWDGSERANGWRVLYASPHRPDHIARVMKGWYDEGFQHCADADFTLFDATQDVLLLRNEQRLYKHLCALDGNALLALKCQLAPKGKFRIKMQTVAEFSAVGRRQSGDPNTTVGNTFSAAVILMSAFRDLGLPPGCLAVAGDDIALFTTYSLAPYIRAIIDRFEHYGTKLEAYHRPAPHFVHFLGSRVTPCQRETPTGWVNTWILMPELGRAIPKFGWSMDPQSAPRAWATQVATAFRHLSFCPILGAFIRTTLRLSDQHTQAGGSAVNKPKLGELPYSLRLGGFDELHAATTETWTSVADSYGMTVKDLLDIEECVAKVKSIPCLVASGQLEDLLRM